jgi:hypothetical protein
MGNNECKVMNVKVDFILYPLEFPTRANGTNKAFVFLLHFFVLIQRNEAKKNQGKPDRSARFAL